MAPRYRAGAPGADISGYRARMPRHPARCAAAAAAAIAFALGGGPAWADCVQPMPALGLSQGLEEAADRYRDLDLDGFRAAMDRVAAELPCLTEPLTPALALRIHQL